MDPTTLGKRKRSHHDDDGVNADGDKSRADGDPSNREEAHMPYSPSLDTSSHHQFKTGRQTASRENPSTGSFQILPVELQQYVFSFLDPFSLLQCSRINKLSRALLDAKWPLPPSSNDASIIPLKHQDAIWSSSRRLYFPDVPRPVSGLSELEMHLLVHGRRCQFCGRRPRNFPSAQDTVIWNMGPGPHGIRSIWPFKVLSCAKCLEPQLVKEVDLMIDASSYLQPGLPFAIFTPSLHYITVRTLKGANHPQGLNLTKYYYRPQIERLKAHATEVRSLGSGAFEEWYKGLAVAAAEAATEIGRFEHWEMLKRVSQRRQDPLSILDQSSTVSGRSANQISSTAQSAHTAASSLTLQNLSTLSCQKPNGPSSAKFASLPNNWATLNKSPSNRLTSSINEFDNSHDSATLPSSWVYRTPRGPSEILSIKAQRRLDIERRCQELVPPLTFFELEDMDAFRAALQISRPLDDGEWIRLRGRLVAERNAMLTRQASPSHNVSDSVSRATIVSDILDKQPLTLDQWRYQAARPTREKVEEIAHNLIIRHRTGGTDLTVTSAPKFAAEVLSQTREQFYQIQQEEDAALVTQGVDPPAELPSGMRTRTLQLDHMKHVFEKCIKPVTEFVRKDLFLCHLCGLQGKYFAFEPIIQHFAHKHTEDFSRGNSVVYWKSIWPENPPYHPDPDAAAAAAINTDQDELMSETLSGTERPALHIEERIGMAVIDEESSHVAAPLAGMAVNPVENRGMSPRLRADTHQEETMIGQSAQTSPRASPISRTSPHDVPPPEYPSEGFRDEIDYLPRDGMVHYQQRTSPPTYEGGRNHRYYQNFGHTMRRTSYQFPTAPMDSRRETQYIYEDPRWCTNNTRPYHPMPASVRPRYEEDIEARERYEHSDAANQFLDQLNLPNQEEFVDDQHSSKSAAASRPASRERRSIISMHRGQSIMSQSISSRTMEQRASSGRHTIEPTRDRAQVEPGLERLPHGPPSNNYQTADISDHQLRPYDSGPEYAEYGRGRTDYVGDEHQRSYDTGRTTERLRWEPSDRNSTMQPRRTNAREHAVHQHEHFDEPEVPYYPSDYKFPRYEPATRYRYVGERLHPPDLQQDSSGRWYREYQQPVREYLTVDYAPDYVPVRYEDPRYVQEAIYGRERPRQEHRQTPPFRYSRMPDDRYEP